MGGDAANPQKKERGWRGEAEMKAWRLGALGAGKPSPSQLWKPKEPLCLLRVV